MASKYGNKKTERDGILFDSRKEAERYGELVLLQRAGKVRGLRLQPEFTLQEAFTSLAGEKVRAIRYRADFAYQEPRRIAGALCWVDVVEDVKGYKTKEYELKRKMMENKGISIREI